MPELALALISIAIALPGVALTAWHVGGTRGPNPDPLEEAAAAQRAAITAADTARASARAANTAELDATIARLAEIQAATRRARGSTPTQQQRQDGPPLPHDVRLAAAMRREYSTTTLGVPADCTCVPDHARAALAKGSGKRVLLQRTARQIR